jgi:hypothetical protein
VPSDATGGTHTAAIVLTSTDGRSSAVGLVMVQVGTGSQSLHFDSLSAPLLVLGDPSKTGLCATVSNRGTTSQELAPRASITDIFGHAVNTTQFAGTGTARPLLPGESGSFPVLATASSGGGLPGTPGLYTVTVTVYYGGENQPQASIKQSVRVIVAPLSGALRIFLVIIGIYLGITLLEGMFRAARPRPAGAPVGRNSLLVYSLVLQQAVAAALERLHSTPPLIPARLGPQAPPPRTQSPAVVPAPVRSVPPVLPRRAAPPVPRRSLASRVSWLGGAVADIGGVALFAARHGAQPAIASARRAEHVPPAMVARFAAAVVLLWWAPVIGWPVMTRLSGVPQHWRDRAVHAVLTFYFLFVLALFVLAFTSTARIP